MGILDNLLQTIFTHPAAAQTQAAPHDPQLEIPIPHTAENVTAGGKPQVDIEAVMDHLVAERGENLDWKHSVVDLLKAVGLDSSADARLRLAKEMHYSGDLSKTSVQLNEWLHDEVLKIIEHNGGKLPDDIK